jgi:hypothetical protein
MPPPDDDRHGGRGMTQTRLRFVQKRHTSKWPPPLARARSSPPPTPTGTSRQPSVQPVLDEDIESDLELDEATLDTAINKAKINPDEGARARFLGSLEAELVAQGHADPQGSAEPRPNGGPTAESPLADEHVPAATTAAEATEAEPTASVATPTPAHLAKKNTHGKRVRGKADLGRTPGGIVAMEGGDRTPKFGIPPVFKGPGSTEGLSLGEQKLRSAVSADNAGMARYIMTGLGEYLGNMLTASHEAHAAQLQSVLANQGKIYEELQSTRRKVAALEAKLEHQSIQQNRIAATVAQGTTAAPQPTQRNEGQEKREREKREREKREREKREGQKRMEAERREEGQKRMEAGKEKVDQKRMEAEKERAPEERRRDVGRREPPKESGEASASATAQADDGGDDNEGFRPVTRRGWADRAKVQLEQERAAVAQPLSRPRPQWLIPKEKYPKAQREVIVEFEELKRPQGVDDRHLADLALRDVNRAMLNHQDVKQFPFHLARVTASSNIVLTAAGNVRGVVYTDYVNVIADALKTYGNCTAKVHEKWSKFLVRGVPVWMELEGIREDIERKYPGIRLAQSPGWLVPASRREGVPESTVLIALMGQVSLSSLGNRIAIGSRYCKVEQYFEFTDYTQCTRCQAYGHVAERCKKPHARCAVCAKYHDTKDHSCDRIGCRQGPACTHVAKCTNCDAPHKANNRLCPHRHNAYRAYHKRRGFSDAEATTAAAQFVEFDQ